MLPENTIICGAMPGATKHWPSESVNCSISSPPYWALRDYGVPGQLGLEPTFEEYIDKLCTIYDEVKRILRKDGTCWVNLGDTYGGMGTQRSSGGRAGFAMDIDEGKRVQKGIVDKSLCLIPQRFAIEMVNRGWILRNVIIWHKPNPMPSSAKDRFTVDFEYIYFFVKSKKYWFEPQYEPYLTESNAERPRMGQGNQTKYMQKRAQHMGGAGSSWQGHSGTLKADGTQIQSNPLGRNKRCVWTIPTQPYSEAHFATFPEKLVEPMIKAGCPEFICTKCGKAREKIYEISKPPEELYTKTTQINDGLVQTGQRRGGVFRGSGQSVQNWTNEHPPTFKGYTDCGCGADWRPGIVLDCFCREWDYFTGSRQIAA